MNLVLFIIGLALIVLAIFVGRTFKPDRKLDLAELDDFLRQASEAKEPSEKALNGMYAADAGAELLNPRNPVPFLLRIIVFLAGLALMIPQVTSWLQ